jgi:hypothetical protein
VCVQRIRPEPMVRAVGLAVLGTTLAQVCTCVQLVRLVLVAPLVCRLAVRPRVLPAPCQRDDVVYRTTHRVRVPQGRVDALLANGARPITEAEQAQGIDFLSPVHCPAALGCVIPYLTSRLQ